MARKKFDKLKKPAKANVHKTNYDNWKALQFEKSIGFFPIFENFVSEKTLCKVSGNALRLYIFFGINSNSVTGESWYSIESIAKYFDRSPRTISTWIKELKDLGLIDRIQFQYEKEAHTYLKPY